MKIVKCLPEFEYFYCIIEKRKLYFQNKKIKSYRLCSFKSKLLVVQSTIWRHLKMVSSPSTRHVCNNSAGTLLIDFIFSLLFSLWQSVNGLTAFTMNSRLISSITYLYVAM